MEKQLVKLTWSISLFFVLNSCAFAGSPSVKGLAQNELSQPETVRQWLQKNADKADRKMAEQYFQMGNDYAQKKYWSGAAKAFGESAHAYPAPKTLLALTSAELKMLAEIRARKKGPNTDEKADLEYAVSMFKAALAADDVLRSLNSNERKQLEYKIQCVTKYVEAGTANPECSPLKDYGIVD
jgi:hypothetical protein